MKTLKIAIAGILAIIIIYSCKKDDTIGGSLFVAKVNMTTYDYLKTNHLFDTLVVMIDKMQLKEEVNKSATFFAVTNYSIHKYVNAKRDQLRVSANDENLVFTFDSLNLSSLKDSLRAYMFNTRVASDNLDVKGQYIVAHNGEKRLVQARPTDDYTNVTFTTKPIYIYLTKIYFTGDSTALPQNIDEVTQLSDAYLLNTLCQTTGIITTTGTLHVLSNQHTFTYFLNTN